MKLYETITRDNWIKGKIREGERACLMGHLYARHGWLSPFDQEIVRIKKMNESLSAIRSAIQILYPERSGPAEQVADFNDHPDTTIEDILRVCKVADV